MDVDSANLIFLFGALTVEAKCQGDTRYMVVPNIGQRRVDLT